ncbi:MAG: hypothetical protein ABSF84_02675 [Acidimicrobiales bacterium]
MTLVEVIVAGVVLLITMIPMGILLTNVSSDAVLARQHQAAEELADSWIQILSNTSPPTNPSTGTVLTNETPTTLTQAAAAAAGAPYPGSTFAGTTFTAQALYTENAVNDVGQSDLCSAGTAPSPSHPAVIQLQVNVTWGSGTNVHTVTEVTEIDFPRPGSWLQAEGFLAINVSNEGDTDQLGNSAQVRLQAIPVGVTQTAAPVTPSDPTGSPTLTTPYKLYPDADGCIFAEVPVGTYTVAALQPSVGAVAIPGYSGLPPFVTTGGSQTDTQAGQVVTVSAEQVVPLYQFDEGMLTNVSYAGASAVDRGVTCPDAAGLTCVALGDGPTGASAAWGGSGAAWTSTTLSTRTHVNQVSCITATPSKCVGVGYYSSAGGTNTGIILSTTSDFTAQSSDNVPPTVTDITQVICPSTDGCLALGTTSSGPVLLAGKVVAGSDSWTIVTPPLVTITALDSIACPTPTTCELSYAGIGSAPGILTINGDPSSPSLLSFASDILPGQVYSVGTIACPSSTDCLAAAVGGQASPTDATVITTGVTGDSWTAESSFPSGGVSVTGISCDTTSCVAIGAVSTTQGAVAAVWTGDLTATPEHNWVLSNAIPNNVAALNSVACGTPASGDTAACVVAATTSGTSGLGELLVGSQTGTGSSWAWNLASEPSGTTVQYYLGVSCESPATATNAVCAAIGETTGGPIILTSPTGPTGSWSNQTPSSLPGALVDGIPVETSPAQTTSWTTQIPWGYDSSGSTGSLPVLYPGAYSIAAGDCAGEASTNSSSSFSGIPGGTATAVVPLGLLPLQLVTASGAVVSGATVTITSTSCGTDGDYYNLPATDAQGVTMTSVPYGSYSYSVTSGSSAVAPTNVTLVVGADSVTVKINGTATSQSPYYLPAPIQVLA